jgi:predicted helicase
MKPTELRYSEQCKVVLGTYAFSSEGLDIASLDTLVMASPKSDVVQIVGRILRKQDAEYPPLVIDIVDPAYPTFAAQAKKRKAYYKSCAYIVHDHSPPPPKAIDEHHHCLVV